MLAAAVLLVVAVVAAAVFVVHVARKAVGDLKYIKDDNEIMKLK